MLETLTQLDKSAFHFINRDMANGVMDLLCPWLRERLVWIPLYILIAYYFFRLHGNKTALLILGAMVTIVLSDQISSSIIKPWFHRLRPCNNPMMNARLLLVHCGAGFSFVSSHAANHFAIATFIALLAPNKKLHAPLLFLWAFIVSFSQVYVGVHYPIDVIGGAIVGIAIGSITAWFTNKYLTTSSN